MRINNPFAVYAHSADPMANFLYTLYNLSLIDNLVKNKDELDLMEIIICLEDTLNAIKTRTGCSK